jgi:hypothetical protein
MKRTLWAMTALLLVGCHHPAGTPDAGAPPDAGPQVLSEKEPNNGPDQALALGDSAQVNAALDAKGDEDWYRLSSPSPRAVDLEVSGIPGAKIQLEVIDQDRNRMAVALSDAPGQPLHLRNLGVTRDTWLRVTSATKGAGGSYTLLATFHTLQEGFEIEPNDRAADSTPVSADEKGQFQVKGVLGHAGDEDWFRIELAPSDGGAEVDAGASITPADARSADAGAADAGAVDAGVTDGGSDAGVDAGVAEIQRVPLRIQLSGVPNVRLEVELLSEAQASLFDSKTAKEGDALDLRNVGVRASDRVIYAVVRAAWNGTGKEAKRGTNPDVPYTLTIAPEAAGANSELEPNDTLDQATSMPPDGYREGFLAPKSDLDFYEVKCPQPAITDLSLSGTDRLDLVLSVVRRPADGGADEEVLRANDGQVKEPEYLNSVACSGDLFVRVEGASKKVNGKWVRDYENPDQAYRLTAKSRPDTGADEREPNNTPENATVIQLGHALRGTIQPKKDVDDYKLDLSDRPVKTAIRATLTQILKVKVGLYLYRVEDGQLTLVQTSDHAKGDQPEVIQYSADPGVYVFQVRDVRNREANFQDAYLLTVEQSE